MVRFTLRRLGSALLLLYLVLTATFVFIHLAPGEPSRLYFTSNIDEEQRQVMREAFGLDRPIWVQYTDWLGAMVRGDWGASISSGRPAARILLEKLPNTLLLVLAAVMIEHTLGILLGLVAATRAGGRLDRGLRLGVLFFYSLPPFVLALVAVELLATQWQLFPAGQIQSNDARFLSGWPRLLDRLHHLALPALVLGISRCAAVMQYVRSSLLENLGQDYIRTARAKGLSSYAVLQHALRNSLIPLVQRLGVALPILLGGGLIIEVIFSWPGIGNVVYVAVLQRDYPVVLASTALSGFLVILGSTLADLAHAWLDPRVRNA